MVATPGRWVVGALAQNVWSVAGDSDRANVNKFLLPKQAFSQKATKVLEPFVAFVCFCQNRI